MIIKLLTTRQVAEQLGVQIWAVYHYIKEGTLKAHKIGGYSSRRHWRIKEEDLLVFIGNGNDREEAGTRETHNG